MLRAELAAAFLLLTRLPLGFLARGAPLPEQSRCIWAYPIAGAAIGAIAASALLVCRSVAMPPPLAAVWTLAAATLLTGALHEDGLADTADGFGGGHTRERKLAIMRDSRIGTYGAMALLLSTAIRITAITALAQTPAAAPALIAAGALSRGALAFPLLALPPARPDGLAAPLGKRSLVRTLVGPMLATLLAFLLLPPGRALEAILASCIAIALLAALARWQIGGYTGDVLGAGVVTVECVVLTFLALACA